MHSKIAALLFFLLGLSVQINCYVTNYDQNDPTVIVADELPLLNSSIDTKLMAYVGNGHLASTVFDSAIYVNGLYNGARGVSHRARLPNMHNFQIKGSYPTKQYVLDMKNGGLKLFSWNVFPSTVVNYSALLSQASLLSSWRTTKSQLRGEYSLISTTIAFSSLR